MWSIFEDERRRAGPIAPDLLGTAPVLPLAGGETARRGGLGMIVDRP